MEKVLWKQITSSEAIHMNTFLRSIEVRESIKLGRVWSGAKPSVLVPKRTIQQVETIISRHSRVEHIYFRGRWFKTNGIVKAKRI